MKKIIAVLLLLALALGTLGALADTPKGKSVTIDAKHFPDEPLRKYVKKHFDKNKDGKLSAKERNAVKSIVLFSDKDFERGVEQPNCNNLAGIEMFPNLERLECPRCGLEALNVSKNKKLVKLVCYENQGLIKLDVTKNTRLVELVCYYCNLSALNVTKCPNLKILDCGMNPIKKLDVTRNPKLEKLFCNGHYYSDLFVPITRLNLSKNPNLKALNCSDTRLAKLDVSKNTQLEYLCCEGLGKLKALNTSKNPNLVMLYAGRSGINKLDIANNKKLQECLNGKADINAWVDDYENTIYWGSNVEMTGVEHGILVNTTTRIYAGSKVLYKGNK